MITLSTELKFTHTVKYQRLLICRISSINRFLEVTFFLKFLHHIKKKTEAHLKPCHDYKAGQIELLNQKHTTLISPNSLPRPSAATTF